MNESDRFDSRELSVIEFNDGKRLALRAAWADNRAPFLQIAVTSTHTRAPFIVTVPRRCLAQLRAAVDAVEAQQPSDVALPRHVPGITHERKSK